jgi:ferritin
MTDRNTILALKEIMEESFNKQDLHDLCFRLDIDKDQLPGTKTPLINELLEELNRHDRIPELLNEVRALRPEQSWPQLPEERIGKLKEAIGRQDSKEIGEIFFDIIKYLKQLNKQRITERDEARLDYLEMFVKRQISGAKLVRIWEEHAKQPEPVDQGPDYNSLADQLKHGEIVIFIGERLPTDPIENLTGEASIKGTFTEICEYLECTGRDTLLRKVSNIQRKKLEENDSTYKALYDLLCEVKKPLAVISATYDSKLEDVFRAQNKPFNVLSHAQSSKKEAEGNILVQNGAGGAPKSYTAEQLSEIAPLENGISLIYKIRGCFHYIEIKPSLDTLTLSERDYFRLARYIDKLIPDYLANKLHNRSLWFFGHYPDSWESRLLIHAVQDKNPGRSFAIQPDPDPFAQTYWKGRKIELYRLVPKKFIQNLAHYL